MKNIWKTNSILSTTFAAVDLSNPILLSNTKYILAYVEFLPH